jgi:hypothetical protein
MTPHHTEYYRGTGAPTDFDDPIPHPFISIRGVFLIAVSCDIEGDYFDQSATENGKNWENVAFTLLSEALEHWGIGGKTNAGYGRMEKLDVQSPPANPVYTSRLFIAGKVYPPPLSNPKSNQPDHHSGSAFNQDWKNSGSKKSGGYPDHPPGKHQIPSFKLRT